MSLTIPQITKKYLEGKTQDEFAAELGIDAEKQSVSQWVNGKHEPGLMTLFRVIGSDKATHAAREWARECINVLQAQAGIEFEPTLDEEIERRR